MPTYRAYRLDADREFRSGVWIDARNDLDAVQRAEELCDPATPFVEVRKADRVIDEVDCEEVAEEKPSVSRSGSRGVA
ncbi:MAG: hypothetical protein JF588_20350 [Caulobacterales bacterium]|nr:hypothetical protein [Caulobacterales bacterium]